MNDNELDKALKQSYNNAKQRYPAPGRIKRAVLAEQKSQWQWHHFFTRAAQLPGKEWYALTAAIGCVWIIYSLTLTPVEQTTASNLVALQVEYHGYEDEKPVVPDYRESLKIYNREYASQIATLSQFYSRSAVLVKHEGDWLFKDCQNLNITISNELVDDLRALQRIDPELVEGTFVELAFDAQGRLINISPSTLARC